MQSRYLFRPTKDSYDKLKKEVINLLVSMSILDRVLSAATEINLNEDISNIFKNAVETKRYPNANFTRKAILTAEIITLSHHLLSIPHTNVREFISFTSESRKDPYVFNIEQQFKQSIFVYLPRFALALKYYDHAAELDDEDFLKIVRSSFDKVSIAIRFFEMSSYFYLKRIDDINFSISSAVKEMTKDLKANIKNAVAAQSPIQDSFSNFSKYLKDNAIAKNSISSQAIDITYGNTLTEPNLLDCDLRSWQSNMVLSNVERIISFYTTLLENIKLNQNALALYAAIDHIYNYLDSMPKDFKGFILQGLRLKDGSDLIWCNDKAHKETPCMNTIRIKIMHSLDGSLSLLDILKKDNEIFQLESDILLSIVQYSLALVARNYQDLPYYPPSPSEEDLHQIKTSLTTLFNSLPNPLPIKIEGLEDLAERFNTAACIIPQGLRRIIDIKKSWMISEETNIDDQVYISTKIENYSKALMRPGYIVMRPGYIEEGLVEFLELDAILMGLGEACRNLDICSEVSSKREGFLIDPIEINNGSCDTIEKIATILKEYRGDRTHACYLNHSAISQLFNILDGKNIEDISDEITSLSQIVLTKLAERVEQVVSNKITETKNISKSNREGYEAIYDAVDAAVSTAKDEFCTSKINTSNRIKDKFCELINSRDNSANKCNIL